MLGPHRGSQWPCREHLQRGPPPAFPCYPCRGAKEQGMTVYWMWWIAAAALVAAELLTGTFYLLVIGVALACGGIAAWLGVGMPLQWLTAGVLGIAGTLLLQRWKRQL